MINTDNKTVNIAVAVMVGGKSERMGHAKETVVIPHDGRTFLDRICDEVDITYSQFFFQRYLSVRAGQNTGREGYVNVADLYPGIGPLGGIYSVLEKVREDGGNLALFLACDLIRYDHTEIINIFKRYNGEDILFTRTSGRRLQPLASIYSVKTIPSILSMIESGRYRITDIESAGLTVGYYDTGNDFNYENQNIPF